MNHKLACRSDLASRPPSRCSEAAVAPQGRSNEQIKSTICDMGSWKATCIGPTLRTGHEPWQVRSGLEEGRAPARPLLISAQRKAAPQRGALHNSDPIPPVPGAGMRFMGSVAKQSRGVRRYPGLLRRCAPRNDASTTYDMGSRRATCFGPKQPARNDEHDQPACGSD